MRGYFVTGTDTGVGKTFVTVALARLAVSRGQRVFAFKPIETGIPPLRGGADVDVTGQPDSPRVETHGSRVASKVEFPLGEDQRALVEAAGGWQTGELRGVYQFELPAAPSVAAGAEGRAIDLEHIDQVLTTGRTGADFVLVEGAGGWRVPITNTVDMGAFAKRLELPVVIVARAGLGTINHSLLTIEAAERQGCGVAALVLSVRPDDDVAFALSNAEQIRGAWNGHVIVFDRPAALEPLL